MDVTDAVELPTGRGRPPKFDSPVPLPHLFVLLETAPCSFAEACRRGRTTPHLVKQMMLADPRIEFEFRVACLKRPRKRLGERWGRPEIILEAALETHRLEHGERPRTWDEVLASIRKRAEAPRLEAESIAREPVTIPAALTPEDEHF